MSSGQTLSQRAIEVAWKTGHFWNPDNPEGQNLSQSDLPLLRPDDSVVVKAMISLSKMEAVRYSQFTLQHHNRLPDFDGVIGPAMEALITDPTGRCPIPDYVPPAGTSFLFTDPDLQKVVERMQRDAALPAFGSGNWKGCHEVGNFHCAAISVDATGLPSFLKPVYLKVLQNVQTAYANVGLLFRFINKNGIDILTGAAFSGTINSDMSFVNNSSGWIGLAIIGQGETCGSKIWCKFLNTYQGGTSEAAITTQWTTLIKHELGHNCGRNHTSGGVMNPSIVNNLPVEWSDNDPSTSWLRGQFGGVPVPIIGQPPGPNPNPLPKTIEEQLEALRFKNITQDAAIAYLLHNARNN